MSGTAEPPPPSDADLLRLHEGGKLEVRGTVPLRDRADLARAYTPGFARVAARIAERPELVDRWSIRARTVAIVTDGTSVSGLGDIGPRAAMPVMEGKALLFKEFAGLDAFPLCLGTTDVDEIVRIVTCLEPTFGAVMLEDISAPRCFAIEERLRAALSIPVLHDDQHATAVAATAALINAARLVGKELAGLKVVISGVGAAGTATAALFMRVGVANVVVCDRRGAITPQRTDLDQVKGWLAEHTNPGREQGELGKILVGADVFVGLSGPGVIAPDDLRTMARDPVVFALANPVPELHPDDVRGLAAVIATGRSDLPNQIDCGLCYPGLFRGALDSGATEITDEMKVAAAWAIAGLVGPQELARGVVVPDIFDGVAPRVAAAVAAAHRGSPPSSPAGSKAGPDREANHERGIPR
jgi:malate dehydrogenase (oxaloacetate-decarboxylating)